MIDIYNKRITNDNITYEFILILYNIYFYSTISLVDMDRNTKVSGNKQIKVVNGTGTFKNITFSA